MRIKIPSTVKSIGEHAFWGCSQLMEVELCKGLERSEDMAFRDCSLLERVSIASTVKYIHYRAFEKCPRLESVLFCEEIERLYLQHLKGMVESWDFSQSFGVASFFDAL